MNELWVTVKRISKLTNISLKMSNFEKKILGIKLFYKKLIFGITIKSIFHKELGSTQSF